MVHRMKIHKYIFVMLISLGSVLSFTGCKHEQNPYQLDWNEYTEVSRLDSWGFADCNDCLFEQMDEGLIRGDVYCIQADDKVLCSLNYYHIVEGITEYADYLSDISPLEEMGTPDKIDLLSLSNMSEYRQGNLIDLSDNLKYGRARVCSVDYYEDSLFIYVAVWGDKDYITDLFELTILDDNKLVNVVDLASAVWGDEEREEQFDAPAIRKNKNGQIIVIDNGYGTVTVADKDGKKVSKIELSDRGYSRAYLAGRTAEGIPILYSYNSEKKNTDFYYVKGESVINLGSANTNIYIACAEERNVLFISSEGLSKWNLDSGECEVLMSLNGFNYDDFIGIFSITGDEIGLLYGIGENSVLYTVSQDIIDTKEIKILELFYNSDYVSNCATIYSAINPGVNIVYEEINQLDDRTLIELVHDIEIGEGPDIILLNEAQMEMLCNQGVLENLDESIKEETKDQIFKGILKFGETEKGLFAIPAEGTLSTLYIDKNIWSKGNWTISESIDVYDGFDNEGAKRFEAISYPCSANQLLYDLLLHDIENSQFVDVDAKHCNFDSEAFINLLKLCNKAGELVSDVYYDKEELYLQVIKGNALTLGIGGGLIEFSAGRESMPENLTHVGYPNSNAMVLTYCGLAVNAYSSEKDTAIDFINYCLSEDMQINNTTNWIRKDVLQNRVIENTDISEDGGPIFLMDGYNFIPLSGRKDGSSYVDEYIKLMDEGRPLSNENAMIDIILDEAKTFFEGNKSAEEVASIIQSRIQLMLDER